MISEVVQKKDMVSDIFRVISKLSAVGYCVKCGYRWRYKGEDEPASSDARHRWSKFLFLVTCPSCGDDKGHAGILGSGATRWFNRLQTKQQEYDAHKETLHLPSLSLAHQYAQEILQSLDVYAPEVTAYALWTQRDYEREFTWWLIDRSVKWCSLRDVQLQIQKEHRPLFLLQKIKVPKTLKPENPCFWLPITYYADRNEPYIIAFQLRQLEGEEPKYITVSLIDHFPLLHVSLPTLDGRDGQRWQSVWLTEGFFKAEAIAHYLNAPAIGALGTGMLKSAIYSVIDIARRWHKDANLFSAPIVLAPDADAKRSKAVAKAWWTAAQRLEEEGCEVSFAVWSQKYKGIDDALLAGEEPIIVDSATWLSSLNASLRDELIGVKARSRMVLSSEMIEAIKLPVGCLPNSEDRSQTYEPEKRKNFWLDTLVDAVHQPNRRTAPILHDRSPAGSGKTLAVSKLSLNDFNRAGIFVKRLVYIAPEVSRPAVDNLKGWAWLEGRQNHCYFYDRLSVLEEEGLSHIGKRICQWCPKKKQCGWSALRQGKKTKVRVSFQSYAPKKGDGVILDEFSRLPIWTDFHITAEAVKEVISVYRKQGETEVAWFLETVLTLLQRKHMTNAEFVKATENFKEDLIKISAEESTSELTDWMPLRRWVFKDTDERPKHVYWLKHLADILTGKVTGQVWVEDGHLRIKVLSPKLRAMLYRASFVLILDATLNSTELENLLGVSVISVKSDEPERYPKVIQVPLGAMSHRAKRERKERFLKVVKLALQGLKAKGYLPEGKKLGILTHKDVSDIAQTLWKNAVVGWWCRDDRATNTYYEAGVDVLVVVGLPHRKISDIAAEKMKAGKKEWVYRKTKLDAEGRWWTVLREFEDEELAQAVRREASIAYLQAAGRLRQGRRSEQTYMVVFDTEPLPLELNPTIILPEKLLPSEALSLLEPQRGRNLKETNALRQKAKAERIARAMEAIAVYQQVFGETPSLRWFTKATGLPRRTAHRYLQIATTSVCQTVPHDGDNNREAQGMEIFTQSFGTVCHTLEGDIAMFLSRKLPVPYSDLARKHGVHREIVRRKARQLTLEFTETATEPTEPEPVAQTALKTVPESVPEPLEPKPSELPQGSLEPLEPEPALSEAEQGFVDTLQWLDELEAEFSLLLCPACGTELEPEADGIAGCLGCGRAWVVTQSQVKPLRA